MNFNMGTDMPMAGVNNESGFMQQLQSVPQQVSMTSSGTGMDSDATFDVGDAYGKARNRGNYRCSKCGEPKKGHVCPLVPTNYKCNRCGLTKKSCSCAPPEKASVGVQVEMDEEMTTRVLDLNTQGMEVHFTSMSEDTEMQSDNFQTL